MSLPAVSTSSTIGGDVGGTEPSQQQPVGRPQGWEEPHPGVPIPLEEPTGMQALSKLPSEAWRGDMAAKGYGYFRTRSGVARRYSRPGMRPRTTKSPRIVQHNSSEGTVTKTDNITRDVLHSEPTQLELTPDSDELTTCPTPAISTADASTIEDVPHASTIEDVEMSGPETPPPSCDYRSLSLDLTDFSNFTNKALDGVHSNASSMTVCELRSYTQAAPEDDLYGWDAVLKQKLEGGCNSSVLCKCLGPGRRDAGLKRNLLQRVFNLARAE
ncbi:hypothetical protein CONLIGDRAFT_450055 [Coniochaeta ligniaria NRRL 30616]|uniref:Uncharacterized protein n=1 Tax=Coniochaeta ligniaria NRRL 30616 TaxID=1408157 RepID=A0A1J7IJW2_9PEZI|nr:hypothetical protein CONLIGDRAFT_450055 [Coniochaeta ligniaria NRRL 30616]